MRRARIRSRSRLRRSLCYFLFAKHSFRGALFLASVSGVLMMFSGDSNARMVSREQPAKLAAFEGHFDNNGEPVGLYLFGWPNVEDKTVTGVQVPYLLTILAHRDLDTPVIGLNNFPEEDWPLVTIPFLMFHLMAGLGCFMLGVCAIALFCLWRGTLWKQRWLLWVFVFSVFAPLIANQAGWVAAETGRQPWVVHPTLDGDPYANEQVRDGTAMVQYKQTTPDPIAQGTPIALTPEGGETQFIDAPQDYTFEPIAGLRTADAVSKVLSASQVASSIVLFGLIYLMLGLVWLFILNRKIQHGPDDPAGYTDLGKDHFLDAAARRHEASMTDRQRIVEDLPQTD